MENGRKSPGVRGIIGLRSTERRAAATVQGKFWPKLSVGDFRWSTSAMGEAETRGSVATEKIQGYWAR